MTCTQWQACISIHAPTWGATGAELPAGGVRSISIHAPTWGATPRVRPRLRVVLISIHAPTWGATSDHSSPGRLLRNFNPRTHVGCDLFPGLTRVWRTISIHAPTWGATQQHRRHLVPHHLISIHAPTWGATPHRRKGCRSEKFQSTHPRGVRPRKSRSSCRGGNFNPRTHVGCDFDWALYEQASRNFNPRTHVGCDGGQPGRGRQYGISIHAPTWGATPNRSGFDLSHEFQSTHPRGVRLALFFVLG